MRKKVPKELLISLCAALVITLLAAGGALRRADKWVQDALFQRPGITSPDIVLVEIDDQSLNELGPYQTWTREITARALEALAADPQNLPAVVAVDTLFAGGRTPQEDARLAEAARKLNTVTASVADFGTTYDMSEGGVLAVNSHAVLRYEEPYPALREASVQGHINEIYDQDGIMRHGMLYVDVPDDSGQSRRVYSMAYEAARLFLGGTVPLPPTDARGRFYIPFTGEPGDFSDGISFVSLVRGEVPPAELAGKIVLIGPYAVGLQDAYYTPADRARQMYGVELQANVIQSLLEGSFKQEAADLPQLAVLFALSFGLMLLFQRLRLPAAGLAGLGAAAAGIGVPVLLYSAGWVTHPLWLPFAVLLLYGTAVVLHYGRAVLARQQVTRTFERYVAPEIVQEILKEGTDSLRLGGAVSDITVLFVDIRGFTTMSERLSPERVVWILNQYLAMTSDCVERRHGTLDKFVGDATMAFWGAPVPCADPVGLAAETAFDILRGAEELSARLKEEIGEELRVGIGVHTGPAIVGNMGSERRMDYTAIGDTVNTAARLESNAPGGTVYISRAVADALGDRAETESLGGSVRLKGKAEGFEVLILKSLKPGRPG